jgi:hypothetical protein
LFWETPDDSVFDAFPRSGERGYNPDFIFDKALGGKCSPKMKKVRTFEFDPRV